MITVELDNFSLKEICQSGQCFRMRETEENTYELIAGDQYLKLTQEGTIVTFYCSDVEFLCYWVPYFDLDADYGGYIEKINPRDRYLCAAAASGSGIRILRQDLWEMIITFLISQQNNITRIRGCIDRLCKRYGEKKVSLDGMEYWSFPTPQQLGTATEEELRALGMGYRARYLWKLREHSEGRNFSGKTLQYAVLPKSKTGTYETQRGRRKGSRLYLSVCTSPYGCFSN